MKNCTGKLWFCTCKSDFKLKRFLKTICTLLEMVMLHILWRCVMSLMKKKKKKIRKTISITYLKEMR